MTEDTLAIEHQRDGSKGRYAARVDGGEAELTYRLKDGVMAIDHTFTPPQARGRNIARRIAERAVDDARAEGLRVDPICPYVKLLFERKPEWASLRA